MSNEIAVISQPTQQVQTTPAKSAASIWSKSSSSTAVTETTKQRDDRVTLQDAQDAAITGDPRRFAPEHLAMAQQTFARFKSPQLLEFLDRNGGMSNVYVNEFVAKVGYALAAKDAEIAALKRNQR